MTWQPIETAPKDGTKIDLWMVDEDGNGWREPDAYYVTDTTYERFKYGEKGWERDGYGVRDGWWAPNHDYDGADGWCDQPEQYNPHPRWQKVEFIKPTHWMPLPEPP